MKLKTSFVCIYIYIHVYVEHTNDTGIHICIYMVGPCTKMVPLLPAPKPLCGRTPALPPPTLYTHVCLCVCLVMVCLGF